MNDGFNAATEQNDNWRTPAWLFKALDTEFAFTLDGAADKENHLLKDYFSVDGVIKSGLLHRSWDSDPLRKFWEGERVYCNPPYSNILPFIRLSRDAEIAVFLLPVRTRSVWFEKLRSDRAEFRWLRKRIAFDPPPGVKASQPRMDTLIAIVRPR